MLSDILALTLAEAVRDFDWDKLCETENDLESVCERLRLSEPACDLLCDSERSRLPREKLSERETLSTFDSLFDNDADAESDQLTDCERDWLIDNDCEVTAVVSVPHIPIS